MADAPAPTIVRYASKTIDLFVDEYPRYPEGLNSLPPNHLPAPGSDKKEPEAPKKEAKSS